MKLKGWSMSGRQCPLVPAWAEPHKPITSAMLGILLPILGYSCCLGRPESPSCCNLVLLVTFHCLLCRTADPLHPAAERGSGGDGCPELLPDLFLWHPPAHLLRGHRHLPHCRWAGPLLQSSPEQHRNGSHPVLNNNCCWITAACVCLWSAGLTMHASILAYMFNLVEEGKISTPLNPGNPVNNQMFIQEYVANLLKSAFPHLQE